MVTTGTFQRVQYLDGIRAVGILAVIAVHWFSVTISLGTGGYVGVDLFFVLSGFIITATLWKSRYRVTFPDFLGRRVRRLYPALLGLVVIGCPAVVLAGASEVRQALTAGVLTLLQLTSFARATGLSDAAPFFHSWSLSVEWVFYLLWPLAVLRFRGADPRRLAVGVTVAAIALYLSAIPLGAQWFYYGPVSRFAQLLAGCAVALFVASGSLPRIEKYRPLVVWGAAVGFAFIVVWALVGPSESSPLYRLAAFPMVTLASVALILTGQLSGGSWVSRFLAWRPLAILGRVSYSLYLWHLVAPALLRQEVMHLPDSVMLAMRIVLTAALTWASYEWLEKPFFRSRSYGAPHPGYREPGYRLDVLVHYQAEDGGTRESHVPAADR